MRGVRAAVVAALVVAPAAPAGAQTAGASQGAFTASPIVVGHADVVEADAGLAAFFIELSRATLSGEARPDLFASPIRVFAVPADPLAPLVEKKPVKLWNELGLRLRAEGEVPPRVGPDQDPFLAWLAMDLGGDEPLGRVAAVGGAVCQPATFDVDRPAVAAALKKIGGRAEGLRYSTEPVTMRVFRPGPTTIELPAGTLLMRVPNTPGAELPRDPRFATTDGQIGYLDRSVARGEGWRSLRRHHTCFAEVNGAWKITAVVFAKPD